MVVSSTLLLAALSIPAVAFADERPQRPCDGSDDFPDGYCRTRTTRDKKYVKEWIEEHGSGNSGGEGGGPKNLRRALPEVSGAPVNPYTPGEYEAVEGIMLAYDRYAPDVVAAVAAGVTLDGGAKVFMVSSAYQKTFWEADFRRAGVDMNRTVWVEESVDSVWIRDYGPRFICAGRDQRSRSGIDTRFYKKWATRDEYIPTALSGSEHLAIGFGHNNHNLKSILHSGGNGHYFSTGKAFATSLLIDDNRLTVHEANETWVEYHGSELHILPQLSSWTDGTGHIDMWLLPCSDDSVIIGQWARDSHGAQKITNDAAAYMESEGYTVYRTPNWKRGGKHYTYTNAVIANDIVIIPKYFDPRDTRAKTGENVFDCIASKRATHPNLVAAEASDPPGDTEEEYDPSLGIAGDTSMSIPSSASGSATIPAAEMNSPATTPAVAETTTEAITTAEATASWAEATTASRSHGKPSPHFSFVIACYHFAICLLLSSVVSHSSRY
ncbi:hypothetical protein THAOC_01240 [Thalassiosira oceanica]|uniref:Uncharacterized protein n=1 Tax=Thalassiosira oceanica TaxID=159749 RepID=K0THL8_THAOC|nr:hypothetical protein THAOC_01240 [Thalassiosira oceanica]|eukprot:EJK76965.1 hypothetical protein THAOC_01240 [Thalassiosira oceanica]